MFKKDKLFFKNFVLYFLGLGLSGLISFLSIPIIVKFYGIEKYGVFSLFQNIVLIFISFGGGWLNQCILRLNDYSQKFKVCIYQLCFIVLIPLIFICFVVIETIRNDFWICLFGISTMILGIISLMSITFFQSKLNASKSFYFDLIRIVSFVLSIYLFHIFLTKFDSLYLLLFSFLLSYFFSFLFILKVDFRFLFISIKLFFKHLNYKNKLSVIKENKYLLSYGWPIALWFSVSAILNVSDRYIISYYSTNEDLGIYSATYDLLYKGVSLLFSPILVAGYPIMSKNFNQGLKLEVFKFLRKLIFFEFLIFFLIIMISFIFRSFFIEKVVGIPLTPKSLGIVFPIICGAFIWQLAMLVHKPLEFELRSKLMLVLVLISLLFNVVSNLIFIPIYGILFAAYSTLFSALLYLILCLLFVFKSKINKYE